VLSEQSAALGQRNSASRPNEKRITEVRTEGGERRRYCRLADPEGRCGSVQRTEFCDEGERTQLTQRHRHGS
jgi:hypothetical protein